MKFWINDTYPVGGYPDPDVWIAGSELQLSINIYMFMSWQLKQMVTQNLVRTCIFYLLRFTSVANLKKNSKKTYSSKCATCSELLEYNTTLFVCGYLCVCVCVNISTRMGMLVYLKSYYIISHFLNCRKSKHVLL